MTDPVRQLQTRIGAAPDGQFGPLSKAALFAALSNPSAPALTHADFDKAAAELGVGVNIIRAVRKVEAPRGPFDEEGRPSILFERHVFSRATNKRFDKTNPQISGPAYGPGGYGPFSAQYGRLAQACALDPEGAFEACSWGAFQVLGENAVSLGYGSAIDFGFALRESEAAHLDSFVRFVRANRLVDALQLCKAGNPTSCEAFVSRYNGPAYRRFNYHVKLAEAAR